MSSPSLYREVDAIAWKLDGENYIGLTDGEECQIVEINGDWRSKLKTGKDYRWYSQGPFIDVIFKSHGDGGSSNHGSTLRSIVIKDGKEITQEDMNQFRSFYFVVKDGKTATFSGGRKSRRPKSNKNKRTRRKSLKKQHRRK